MIRYITPLIFSFIFISSVAVADEAISAKERQQQIQDFIQHIFDDNAEHMSLLSREHFSNFAEQQIPRATVVSCSDSRVQADAFHKSPVNDLFFIRNIGNQIISTQGSVEYGIYHLHTPVLLIIGHSHCGAIKAALGDFSKEREPIRHELATLHLNHAHDTDAGVIENVNQQVQYAMTQFKDLISQNDLVVLGTVYDFRDDFDQGHGRLILVNINGEQDPEKLKTNKYIKDFKNVAIGRKK